MENLLLITDIPGYSPQISRLVSMMNYVRFTTLNTVKGLTQNQLDFLLDAQSNSIGALLLHCAAIEYCYQVSTFEKRGLNEEENLIYFMWFHVFEDEINHRGQMRIIRKRTNAE